MAIIANYSYHGTTVPGTWQEVILDGVLEIASRSPIEIINRSKTDELWYSWNYPDETHVDLDSVQIKGDASFVVLPGGKMTLAPDHKVDQLIFTSENNPVDYSVQVIW